MQRPGHVELQQDRRGRGRRGYDAVELRGAGHPADRGHAQHADDQGAAHPAGDERGDQHEADQRGRGPERGQVAEGHERGRVIGHDARVLHGDERDEESDARGNAEFEVARNGVDQPLADRDDAQNQKHDARQEHRAECDLPRVAHAEHDGVREKGVLTHAGRNGDGIVGGPTHDEGARGRYQAGRDEDPAEVHARVGQNGRVDDRDVGHGEKRRHAGNDLPAPVRAVGGDLEAAVQPLEGSGIFGHGWPPGSVGYFRPVA